MRMHFYTWLLVWCSVSTMTTQSTEGGSTPVSYSIEEEKDPGYVIGTVAEDSSLADKYAGSLPSILRFELLTPSPYFNLGTRSSTLRTSRKLDRELICMDSPNEPCILSIDMVVNPSTNEHFQIIKIQITITDKNDNSPMFPQQNFDMLVLEDASVNSSFYLPMAEDRDSEEFGIANYELQAHTEAFRISSVPSQYGGTELLLVLAKELDRETQGSYMLKLIARDFGTPSRSGMMWLNITVGDVNDFSPEFQQPLYSVRVPESAKPEVMLTRLLATDKDSGANGAVKYSISSRATSKIKRLFRMNEQTGELFLRERLDYEDDKTFLILIEAHDSAPLAKRGQSVVNISIADENDNSPHISVTTVGSSRAQVTEHSPNSTFVAHVKVEDKDSGANGLVTCIISSPYFRLQQSYEDEYSLVVNTALDREEDNELNVTILCSDGGSPQRVTRHHMLVNIVDVNDQKPTFDRFVYYSPPILENNAVGIPITQVQASDKDVDTNAEVQYQLGDEADANYFSINRFSGLIKAITSLDREHQNEYTFSVLAIDRGVPALTATAAVFVKLRDVNDNSPTFNVTHYEMSVAENMAKYSFVGKVTAFDPDERTNGVVWYRMVNASSGPFIIAHDTGIISTRAPLDREKVGGGQYQVTVIATDYGTPTLSSEVKINIEIIDENDNQPMFTSAENMTLTCSYQTPINETIGKVIAYDPDTRENGKLGYFIQSGNQYNLFKIEKMSGEVKIKSKIDSSMVGYYRIGVGVHDNGLPTHTVLSTIGIELTKEAYVPASEQSMVHTPVEAPVQRTYNVNLVVVIILSSTSGVLSVILIVAIIRIKRQTKENHSYNCRMEAQKLFSHSGRSSSQQSRPSCGSSWAALSTTDIGSVFSRASASSDNEAEEAAANQTFLTTFSNSNTTQNVVAALQSYDKSNLQKQGSPTPKSAKASCASGKLQRALLNKTVKEPDSDSGTCDDICSVHNSTPVLAAVPTISSQSNQGGLQSFQCKFLSTAGLEEGTESKVPSSISSGNNSINTNSSHHGSPAIVNQNSTTNHNHQDGSVVSAHNSHSQLGRGSSAHCPRPPQESSSDNYPTHNTSEMSDQTINGDRLCAHIDDLFFSEIV